MPLEVTISTRHVNWPLLYADWSDHFYMSREATIFTFYVRRPFLHVTWSDHFYMPREATICKFHLKWQFLNATWSDHFQCHGKWPFLHATWSDHFYMLRAVTGVSIKISVTKCNKYCLTIVMYSVANFYWLTKSWHCKYSCWNVHLEPLFELHCSPVDINTGR